MTVYSSQPPSQAPEKTDDAIVDPLDVPLSEESLRKLRAGAEDIRRGDVHDLGSFAQYLDLPDDD